MYSVVLLAAMTTGGQAPDFHHGCHSYGNCYGACTGNYGIEGLNCHGGIGGYNCWGSCWGSCNGCWGTYSNYCNCSGGYDCWGSCWGSCNGCWGTYSCLVPNGVMSSPYFVQAPLAVGAPVVGTPVAPPSKPGEPIPPPTPKPDDKKPGDAAAPNRARLIVDVPADAKLFIDDRAMKTVATHRAYQTPDLEPGQTYYYEVRVEVERDGKLLSETRRVLVRAGQDVHADFSDVTTTATAKAK
jgi:uncharacterized protein (TIGR03000 family)